MQAPRELLAILWCMKSKRAADPPSPVDAIVRLLREAKKKTTVKR